MRGTEVAMVWKRRCAVAALWLGALLCAAGADAAPVRIYSEDWSGGQGAWGGIGGFRWPRRMFVGHPLAQYAYYFGGSCGMGLRANTIPSVRLRVVTRVMMQGSNRNGFSVNVRTSGGAMIYKYSMGAYNSVQANDQPPTYRPISSKIGYKLNTPYELSSYWFPGTGRYALSLKNLVTGEEKFDGYFHCGSNAVPGCITFDQEAGQGPAVLGRVEVWLGQ